MGYILVVSIRLFLGIILGLGLPKIPVFAGMFQKKVGISLLNDLSMIEYGYLVTKLAGGKPVADVDCRFVPNDLVEVLVDFHLRDGIQSGSGFI